MKRFLYLLIASLLLVGCRSSKHATKTPLPGSTGHEVVSIPGMDKEQAMDAAYVSRVAKNKISKSCVTASVKVRLSGLGKDLSVNGALRMKRDDVVRISLRFLGMEVGLLEFTPQDVLVVDRMNKQYVRAAYSEIGFLRQADLDFYALQSLFWNELFVPGERQAEKNIDRFKVFKSGERFQLTLTDTPKLNYTFTTEPVQGDIEELLVKGVRATDKAQLRWTYGGFVDFSGRRFPTHVQMEVSGTKKNLGLSLRLSSLKNDNDWNTRTTVSSKYTRRSVEEVFKGLKL